MQKESEAKNQTERMRMQKQMTETKDQDLKEYMLSNLKITETLRELENNLENEKEKYDHLQNERIVLDRLTLEMNQGLEKNKGIKKT